jgi:hypothetical protein
MSGPLIPSPLDSLGGRRFALAPRIPALGPNDWMLGMRCGGDVQIVNAQTGARIWISGDCVQGVCDRSEYGAPVIALREPLDFRNGLLSRKPSDILQMPRDLNLSSARRRTVNRLKSGRGNVVLICGEHDSSRGRPLGRAVWAAVAACLVPAILFALLLS